MTPRPLRTILIAEDDPDNRTVACLSLETVGGYTVHACGTGREAVRLCAEVRPDLLLLDAFMPELDGPSVVETLRGSSETSAIPVIFLTASAQSLDVSRYLELGALDVIRKPFDPLTLADDVRKIWEAARA